MAAQWAEAMLRTARALAELDVLLALAEVAARRDYCRPELDESDTLHIVAGRHPVVEASAARERRSCRTTPSSSTSDAQILS